MGKRPSDPLREPIDPVNAIRMRYNKFFTGKPCRHGHVDFRYVKSRVCVVCQKLRVGSKSTIVSELQEG